MKRVKEDRAEMNETGRRPESSEMDMFNFMNRRAESFEKNELEVDGLKRLIDEMKQNRNRVTRWWL